VVLVILSRFPQPSGSILKALEMLAMLREGDPEQMQALGDLSELPRPWEPATCPEHLRAAVWRWCDAVTPTTPGDRLTSSQHAGHATPTSPES
jgi:hypothetical protein